MTPTESVLGYPVRLEVLERETRDPHQLTTRLHILDPSTDAVLHEITLASRSGPRLDHDVRPAHVRTEDARERARRWLCEHRADARATAEREYAARSQARERARRAAWEAVGHDSPSRPTGAEGSEHGV